MSDARARPSRAFLSAAALIGTGIVSLCTFVASREWFSRDDFAFLGFVRKPGREPTVRGMAVSASSRFSAHISELDPHAHFS